MGAGEYQGVMSYVWSGVSWAFCLIIFIIPVIGFFHCLYVERSITGVLLSLSGLCFLVGLVTGQEWIFWTLIALCIAVSVTESFAKHSK